ncbi:hypothetical protein ACFLYW_02820 [Thermodesulfobacteriota bacterium]
MNGKEGEKGAFADLVDLGGNGFEFLMGGGGEERGEGQFMEVIRIHEFEDKGK